MLLFLGFFCLVELYYVWSVLSSPAPYSDIYFGRQQADQYNLLTTALLRGHLALQVHLPAALIHAADPYSAPIVKSTAVQFWDFSLYHKHLYIPFGPTPVLTLFAPWRLLHLGQLPMPLAALLYATMALVGGVMTLCFIADRFTQGTANWKLLTAALAIATAPAIGVLLRQPQVYETAALCGACFSMWGLYFLGTGAFRTKLSLWRLGIGSACFGLSWGARFDLALLGIILLFVTVYVWVASRDSGLFQRWQKALVTIGPFACCGIGLFAYNYLRFGAFLQTGERYALGADALHIPFLQLKAALPGAFYYLVAPPRLSLAFPYIFLPPPPALFASSQYGVPEKIGGAFAIVPITLFLLFLLALFRRRDRRLVGAIGTVLLACGLCIFLAVDVGGQVSVRFTTRYQTDFLLLLVIAAICCWWGLTNQSGQSGRERRRVRLLNGAAVVLIAAGSVIGVAVSLTSYYNSLYQNDPALYRALEDTTAAFPTAIVQLLGRPEISQVLSQAGTASQISRYTTVSAGTQIMLSVGTDPAVVEIVSPRAELVRLTADEQKPQGFAGTWEGTVKVSYATRRGVVEPFMSGPWNLAVKLKPGVNRITLEAKPATRPSKDQAVSPFLPLLTLSDLRIAPAGPLNAEK